MPGAGSEGGGGRRAAAGLWIAFLGPDGSGKSTLVEGVADALGPIFRGVAVYRFRPVFGRGSLPDRPYALPHERPRRGALLSAAQLLYYWLDYVLGYWLDVRARLARGELVLFDRHLLDLLVDPGRYRYGGSPRAARLLNRWVPKPHLTVVLTAPPGEIESRKREVGREELMRQLKEYGALARQVPGIETVDGAGGKEAAREAVVAMALERLGRATGRPGEGAA